MQIKCENCGSVVETIEPKCLKDGDLVYTFFQCKDCRAIYQIAVTDTKLRADIAEYQHRRNHIRISPVTEEFLRETEQIKQDNLTRCHELMEQHPLAHFLEAHPDVLERLKRGYD